MGHFFAGISDFLAGFRMVLAVPGIRKWALIPMALNLVLLISLVTCVFLFSDDVTRSLLGEGKAGWGQIAWWLAWTAALFLGLALAVGLMLVLSSVVAAPFYTKLSESALEHVTGRPVPHPSGPLWKLALAAIGQEVVKLAMFLGIQAILLGIGFIPLVGAVFAVFVTWLLLAFEFVDYALEACGVPVMARYRYVLANTGRCAGFGAGTFLFTLVPLMGIFSAPVAVAGAARLVGSVGMPDPVSSPPAARRAG